jgi:hypothetical protein
MLLTWNITLVSQPLGELSQWVKDIDSKWQGLDAGPIQAFNNDYHII